MPYEEALELFAQADKLADGDADDATVFTNYAVFFRKAGVREALEVYERYLPDSRSPTGTTPRSCITTAGGRGWRHYSSDG
jgi:hypothetical protein